MPPIIIISAIGLIIAGIIAYQAEQDLLGTHHPAAVQDLAATKTMIADIKALPVPQAVKDKLTSDYIAGVTEGEKKSSGGGSLTNLIDSLKIPAMVVGGFWLFNKISGGKKSKSTKP